MKEFTLKSAALDGWDLFIQEASVLSLYIKYMNVKGGGGQLRHKLKVMLTKLKSRFIIEIFGRVFRVFLI